MFISQVVIYSIIFIVIIATFFEPVIGLITYCILDLVRFQNLFWWAFGEERLSLWVASVTIIVWLFCLIKGKNSIRWPAQNKLMALFLLIILISHAFAQLKDTSWISLVRISKMILLYFVTVSLLDSRKRIKWLIWSLVLSIGYLAFMGNWQYFILGWREITADSFGRGVSLDNNGYAMLFVMAFPLAYFLLITEKRKYIKVFLAFILILLMHAVFLTYSRGGFLGLGIVGVFSILKTKKKLILIVSSILFLAIGIRLAGPPVVARINSIKTHEQDASAMERKEAWKAGFRMITERPFTGIGLDNFRHLAMLYNPEKIQNERVAHNAYIHIGAEAGIPALLIYFLLIFLSIRNLRGLRRRFYSSKDEWKYYYPAMVEGSLWGYVVCGMFLTLAWFELFYPMIALTVALKRVTNEPEIKVAVKNPKKAYKLSGNLEPLNV